MDGGGDTMLETVKRRKITEKMEIQYQEAAKILGPTVVKDGQQKVGNC
jgi:hypothetical protein